MLPTYTVKITKSHAVRFLGHGYNAQNGLRQNQDGLRQKLKHFKKLLKRV